MALTIVSPTHHSCDQSGIRGRTTARRFLACLNTSPAEAHFDKPRKLHSPTEPANPVCASHSATIALASFFKEAGKFLLARATGCHAFATCVHPRPATTNPGYLGRDLINRVRFGTVSGRQTRGASLPRSAMCGRLPVGKGAPPVLEPRRARGTGRVVRASKRSVSAALVCTSSGSE
jgi:hypothetical protein